MLPRVLAVVCTLIPFGCGSVGSPTGPCRDGEVECSGECVDLQTDPFNCGACGDVCPSTLNADRTCREGRCGIVCHEGYWDLDGDHLTGCEYECEYVGEVDECNGVDDDCDGTVDNFDVDTCAQGSTVECTTTCGSTGTGLCDSFCNPPEPSECVPPEETCNGVDDDCDSVADDGFDCASGQETECTTTCGSTGTGTCLDTCRIPPPGACIPPDEICNGLDDDCIGGPDDGFDCVAGQETECTTACGSTGTGTCSGACERPGAGECTPPEETCNWTDDDCDGDVDEALWAELIGDQKLDDATLSGTAAVVEFGNTNFLVAYSQDLGGLDGSALYTRALDATGHVVGGGDLLVGPDHTLAQDVAWSGSEFVVGFVDSRFDSTDIFAIRVAENGEAPSVEAYIAGSDNSDFGTRVDWTGSEWGIGWVDQGTGSRLFISGVDASTLIADFTDHVTAGGGYIFGNMDMVWNGSGYGFCWGDNREGPYQLYFKVVTREGLDVVADAPLTSTFDDVHDCSVAWTGSEYVVGFSGSRSAGPLGAYLARVSAEGDLVGSLVELGATGYGSSGPPVRVQMAGTSRFGVAYLQPGSPSDNIVLMRFALAETEVVGVGDPVRVSSSTFDALSPSLAWDGSAFGVTWEVATTMTDHDLYFTRVGCP